MTKRSSGSPAGSVVDTSEWTERAEYYAATAAEGLIAAIVGLGYRAEGKPA